jgi:hypothetical protein
MVIYYSFGRYSVRFSAKQRFTRPWVVWDDEEGRRVLDGEYDTSDEAKARARQLAGNTVGAA